MNKIGGPRHAISAEAVEGVIATLSRGAPLPTVEQDRIRLAGRIAEGFDPGMQVLSGQAARRTGLVLCGWACEASFLLDGRRQIHSILLPGDPIFPRHARGRSGRSIVALTNLGVADISALVGTDNSAPHLAQALRDAAARREDRLLSQIIRLGRLSAYERVVHLLLELRDRLSLIGQTEENEFAMPLTQEAMSDVLGLSIVHLNRTLQHLRRERLVEVRSGRVNLLRPRMLASILGGDESEEDHRFDSRGLRTGWARAY